MYFLLQSLDTAVSSNIHLPVPVVSNLSLHMPRMFELLRKILFVLSCAMQFRVILAGGFTCKIACQCLRHLTPSSGENHDKVYG